MINMTNTPRLELDIRKVAIQYRAFKKALPDVTVYYSVKTNDHPAVLSELKALGSKFEIVSSSDLEAIARASIPAGDVICSNPVAHPDDVKRAYDYGVRVFCCQSTATINVIAAYAPDASVMIRMSMPHVNQQATVNLDKFGNQAEEIDALITYVLSKGLHPYGIHFHVGGQQIHRESWMQSIEQVMPIMQRHHLPFLDMSGGFPVDFKGDEPTIEEIGAVTNPIMKKHRDIIFAAEPGRYIVSNAGTLIYRVLDVLKREDKEYVYIDGSIFGTLKMYAHHPFPCTIEGKDDAPKRRFVLTTNTCDGKDIIDENIALPENIQPGDVLTFHKASADTLPFVNLEYAGLKRHEVIVNR